jgi:hypothetical protein
MVGFYLSAEMNPSLNTINRSSAISVILSLITRMMNYTKCSPALHRISQSLWATDVLFWCECSHFVSLTTDDAHILVRYLIKTKRFFTEPIRSSFSQLAYSESPFTAYNFTLYSNCFQLSLNCYRFWTSSTRKLSSEFKTTFNAGIIIRT